MKSIRLARVQARCKEAEAAERTGKDAETAKKELRLILPKLDVKKREELKRKHKFLEAYMKPLPVRSPGGPR